MGEDGPTHQPIEQLMNLRAVPNLVVIRPADATETTEAWKAALLNTTGPTVLIFTRQNLPVLDRSEYSSAEGLQQGGYILWENGASPQVILLGTGSEVHIALAVGKQLAAEGNHARVVSLPSWELFDRRPADYRESGLPPAVRARVAAGAAPKIRWEQHILFDGGSGRF